MIDDPRAATFQELQTKYEVLSAERDDLRAKLAAAEEQHERDNVAIHNLNGGYDAVGISIEADVTRLKAERDAAVARAERAEANEERTQERASGLRARAERAEAQLEENTLELNNAIAAMEATEEILE